MDKKNFPASISRSTFARELGYCRSDYIMRKIYANKMLVSRLKNVGTTQCAHFWNREELMILSDYFNIPENLPVEIGPKNKKKGCDRPGKK